MKLVIYVKPDFAWKYPFQGLNRYSLKQKGPSETDLFAGLFLFFLISRQHQLCKVILIVC
jgi:hypothetical protein